ncbi:carbohydrate kinase [Sulfitobacter sp. HNIBRBA3233]|uniref:carbohydrate kinase family protein n=1 Tax=Sulfitobacter marinivivus TaxID=3158558 RepID=UPI0032DEE21A
MILCCGEALIDMITAPVLTGGEGFVPHVGGAVFNTAIALGRLGAKAGMLTGLSTDMFGQQLAEALKASHVDTSHVVRSDRPTTLAFVQLKDGHATYSFFDELSAGRMLAPDDLPELKSEISALYFGGISLAHGPCASAYAALLKTQAPQRAIMIDPNIRAQFITDVSSYRSRLDGMMGHADIIKVSDEDLNWLIPGQGALAGKAAALLEKGAAAVIVTRGAEGATGYLENGREVFVPAVRTEVVDTVGAGDTFNAGLLANLSATGKLTKPKVAQLSPDALVRAMEYGARVASLTVSRAGANSPWASELRT